MKFRWGFLVFVAIAGANLFAAETTIRGGRMELLDKGERVVFTGGVTLERAGDTLKAREMTTNKDRDKIHAVGKVELFRKLSSTETFQAFGEQGHYETESGKGYLLGKKTLAHLIHSTTLSTSAVRVIHIYAEKIDFANKQQQAMARGRVRGSSVDPETGEIYEFWSEAADWDGTEKKIVFTGKPFPLVKQTAGKDSKTVTGERIVYHTTTRQFISEGQAQAVFLEPSQQAVP